MGSTSEGVNSLNELVPEPSGSVSQVPREAPLLCQELGAICPQMHVGAGDDDQFDPSSDDEAAVPAHGLSHAPARTLHARGRRWVLPAGVPATVAGPPGALSAPPAPAGAGWDWMASSPSGAGAEKKAGSWKNSLASSAGKRALHPVDARLFFWPQQDPPSGGRVGSYACTALPTLQCARCLIAQRRRVGDIPPTAAPGDQH